MWECCQWPMLPTANGDGDARHATGDVRGDITTFRLALVACRQRLSPVACPKPPFSTPPRWRRPMREGRAAARPPNSSIMGERESAFLSPSAPSQARSKSSLKRFFRSPRLPRREKAEWAGTLMFEMTIGQWNECGGRMSPPHSFGRSYRWGLNTRHGTPGGHTHPSAATCRAAVCRRSQRLS